MAATYKGILTNNGKALIANATVNNKINYSHIAVGDGNGSVPTPLETRTALVNEKARIALNVVEINPNNTNQIVCEAIIPSNIGGFFIRELGLFAGNTMIVNASYPPTYKPTADEGAAREIAIKLIINIQDAEVIALYLDDSLIYATREWVNKNYIRRNEIVDNLTTDDSAKPVSAKQAKKLQDEKFDKTGGTITGNVRQPIDNSQFTFGNDEDFGFIKKNGSKAKIAIGANTKFEIAKSDKDKISFEDNFTTLLTLDQSGVLWCPGGLNANAAAASKLQTARTISYSGAATGSFNFDGSTNVSCLLTLANSGVSAGTYSSRTQIPTITVNSKGLITSISQQSIPFATTNQFGIVQLVNDLNTDDSSSALTARQGKILQDGKFDNTGGTISGNIKTTGSLEVAQTLSVAGLENFAPQKQGAHISWNRNGGQGRTDFINHQGQGGGGFDFWNWNGDAYNLLVTIDASGNYSGNAASASKIKNIRKIFGQDFDGSGDVSGSITTNTGILSADSYHYIDIGRETVDRMNFATYGGIFNFIDSKTGNIIARLNANGIDCNANSASKLKNSRNLWGNSFDGTTDTTGTLNFGDAGARKILIKAETVTEGGYIAVGNQGQDRGYIEIGTTDDENTEIWAAQRRGENGEIVRLARLLDESGNTSFPGNTSAYSFQLATAPGSINRIAPGNGDGASYDTHNMVIRSWWGIGFHDYQDKCRIFIDTRTGNLRTQGTLEAAYINTEGDVNAGNAVTTKNVVASIDVKAGGWMYAAKYVGKDGGDAEFVGNATSSTKLKDKRKICGFEFDGTQDINIFPNNRLLPIGDDVFIGDGDVSGCLVIQSATWTAPGIQFRNSDGSVNSYIQGGNISGNAATASKLQNSRNISISGAVSGNAWFDGSGNINISTTSNEAIGVGQSWQDVTSSRARETTYFNSTGKPIQVLVSFPDSNNSSPRIQVLVDNLTIINHQYDSGGSYGSGQYSFIVPSGQTYRVNTPFGAVDPILWTELR
ncbi:phage tail protein [Acinetobacter ursingii]|uniref:phage tail-collar fiber domain-containing protein n=1 Tax=Acinetobacter ursingii TaxID=108980 RepID=UPI000CBFEC72|nr:hypothetical protein CJ183_08995 [Acinetobacter ursingii]